MPFTMFSKLLPEIGHRETRSITVLPDSGFGLPPDEYAFIELYCDERNCDCRRVFFQVISRKREKDEACIAWGWEPLEFYAEWFKYGDAEDWREMKGPCINRLSPQSELAPALLELARNVLLAEPAYVERIKEHYRLFRETIDGGTRTRRVVQRHPRNRRRRR